MMGHYQELSITLKDDDKLAEAHTEAVNAGVYVRMNGGRTISILDHPEKLRKLSKKIFEINDQEGEQPPAGLGEETEEEKQEREELERMQREEDAEDDTPDTDETQLAGGVPLQPPQ